MDKKILVIGAGKFGINVCKNLKEYLPGTTVTIINRSNEAALMLAEKTSLSYLPYELLVKAIDDSDVIIVCTNAAEPIIFPEQLKTSSSKLLLDLSVPANVHPGVKNIDAIKLIDVDEISTSILDKTLTRRKNEIPKAENILLHYKKEFCSWLDEYRYSLHIKTWKDKLQELNEWQPQQYCELAGLSNEKKAQKAVTRLAVNLRAKQEKGCQFINSINDYLQMS